MASLAPISEYPDIQQEQVSVLDAIYGENFRRVMGQKSAWQKLHNLAFEIRLDALNDKDLSVLLHIELPPEWPKIAPLFKLKEVENVRPHVSDKIRGLLKSVQPDQDVSIICADMQEVMEDAAESKVRRQTVPALAEERAKNEASAMRKAEEEKQQREEAEREQRAQAGLTMVKKVEGLQRVQIRTASDHYEKPPRTLNNPYRVVDFEETMSVFDKEGVPTLFREVIPNFVILKTAEKKVSIATPVVKNDITARRLLLKEIHLDAGIISHPSQLLNEVRHVEQLLKTLKTKHHESVVDVFGYKVVVSQTEDTRELISIDLTILSAFANKGSLAEILDIYGTINGSQAMSWARQLLEALAFFDQLGHDHPAVHLNNILVFRADDGSMSVQLSDGYGTDLRSLVMQARSASGIKEPSLPTNWRAPEVNQAKPARTNKTCLWDLGVAIMQMISGKSVLSEYTSPNNYIRANNFSDPFYDLLTQMCALDQSQRSNAYDLTSAKFFRDDGRLYLRPSSTQQAAPYFAGQRVSTMAHHESPWKSNWEEISSLGKGGFGTVFKARNRFDGAFYAVKKVHCESEIEMAEFLRETKLLSGLKSSRIVRYHTSWAEEEKTSETTSEETSESATQSILQLRSTGNRWVSSRSDYLSGGANIEFQESSSENSGYQQQGFFRDAGEGSSDSDDDDGESGPAMINQDIHRQTARSDRPSTLFIQMELCETHSLRDFVKHHWLKEVSEIWRIFGQIVEGLEYIHRRGVIHRDLKPENIFLDEMRDIRIGDFGLATHGKVASITGKSGFNLATEESRSLGTAHYVAPELRSDGKGAYTSKVDMYSLGITFLEMCVPVKTTTERWDMIANARKPQRVLPYQLSTKGWESQRKLIFRLLNHDQQERPSAKEIIDSAVVPELVGSDQIRKYVLNLIEGDPEQHGELVKHLFGTAITAVQDLAWDSGDNRINPPQGVTVSSKVNQKLQNIFQRHGAVDGKRQGIFPLSSLYEKPATFLDKSGITLQLLYDMTYPFARLVALNKIDHRRQYTFGVVYREGRVGGRPVPLSEVSFDIVSHDAKDLSMKDAEVLKVLDEILAEFPSLKQSRSVLILLNHSDLLEMILEFCGVEDKDWNAVKNILSTINIGAASWRGLETELRKLDLPMASVQQLGQFYFQEDLQNARKRLEKALTSPSDLAKLQQIFTRLLEVEHYAEILKVGTKICMHPLVNYSEPLYRGSIMFQCVDTNVERRILAVGGRYDQLIHSLGAYGPSQQRVPRAVGLRLNSAELTEIFVADLANASKSSKHVRMPQRCDVVVISFDENTLKTTCMGIAADLWANQIRTELADLYNTYDDFESMYKQEEGHCLVVIVRQDRSAVGGVAIRVRTLGKQEEEDVKSTDLVKWIKTELKNRENPDSDQPRTKVRREASTGEPLTHVLSESRPTEFIIVSPKHKGKKINRQHLVEDAGLVVREEARGMVIEAPIVIIEASKEALDLMRSTRIELPETWKSFIQSLPAEETRYLKEVQEKLQGVKDDGKAGVWVYSSKTRACIYYDLGM